MKNLLNSICVFILCLSISQSSAQVGSDYTLFSQLNSGTVFSQAANTELNAVLALPIAINATSGDYFMSSGFDFPIVKTGGSNEISKENWELKVYPTIVTNRLTISCINSENKTFKVEAFDLLGNKIILADINNQNFQDLVNINVSEIGAPGVYLFKITSATSNFSKTVRIVKVD